MQSERIGPPVEGVSEVELDGLISVYSPKTQQVLMMNETASDVWRLADGEHSIDDVVDLLARSYGVLADDIRDQVLATIEDFVGRGLLHGSVNPWFPHAAPRSPGESTPVADS